MKILFAIMPCVLIVSCATPNASKIECQLDDLIAILRNQSVSDDVKREVGAKIKSYGKEAIPILIKNQYDKAVCFPKCRIKSLPRNPPPSMRTTYSLSVGRYCKALIFSIIMHPDDPTFFRSKHMPYRWKIEKNLEGWWKDNKNKKLKQIQREVMEYNIQELDKEDRELLNY